jgi:hypothetical protein
MKIIGIILWLSGAVLAAYAGFGFDPTVDGGPYLSGRIVNQGLQQQQMMMLIAGGVMAVAGIILHVASNFLPAVKIASGLNPDGGRNLNKVPCTVERMNHGRQFGIIETPNGYEIDGRTFNSIDGALNLAKQKNPVTSEGATQG